MSDAPTGLWWLRPCGALFDSVGCQKPLRGFPLCSPGCVAYRGWDAGHDVFAIPGCTTIGGLHVMSWDGVEFRGIPYCGIPDIMRLRSPFARPPGGFRGV